MKRKRPAKEGPLEREMELALNARLGTLTFDRFAKDAPRHFEVGLRIGELSLGSSFDGLLPWGAHRSSPVPTLLEPVRLLCLWRFRRFAEAEQVFGRMLWLNPTDNQGVRFLLAEVPSKNAWLDPKDPPRRGDGSR